MENQKASVSLYLGIGAITKISSFPIVDFYLTYNTLEATIGPKP
jgi:hypothetical protein